MSADIYLEQKARLLALEHAYDAANDAMTRLVDSGTPEQQIAAHAEVERTLSEFRAFQKTMPSPTITRELQALEQTVRNELLNSPPNQLFLPNDHLPAHIAAERIFFLLGFLRELFRRGSAVVEINHERQLSLLTATAFRSRLPARGRSVRAFKKSQNGEIFYTNKACTEDAAKLLLSTQQTALLPEIKLVSRMPVLVERDGVLMSTRPGYNADSGVLVTSNAQVPEFPVDVAAAQLLDLLRDFKFNSPGDRARALAGFIGPALRMGELLDGHALIDVMEADDSQAGKGFLLKVRRAIYGEAGYPVTQKDGGVGSLDESLGQALLSGSPFINLDNMRGTIRSAYLESIVTAGADRVSVRVPYRGEMQVDARRTTLQLSSNGFSTTVDLSNRLLVCRIIKQPGDYQFTNWVEGGLLQRAEKWAAEYLGCVHAIVRHWHSAGKPRLPTTHSFKEWVGSLDWIVQNVWSAGPLLEGHTAAAARIANPSLSWLRQVAFAVLREGKAGIELRAGDLRELCEKNSCPPEGVKPSWADNETERAIGRVMAQCFGETDQIELDGIHVRRMESQEKDEYRKIRPVRFYVFTKP